MLGGASVPASGAEAAVPASTAARATPHHACGFIPCPPVLVPPHRILSALPSSRGPAAASLTIGAASSGGYGPAREVQDGCTWVAAGGRARRGVRDHSRPGRSDVHLWPSVRHPLRPHGEGGERDPPGGEPLPAAGGTGVRVERVVQPRGRSHHRPPSAAAGGAEDQRRRGARRRAGAGQWPVGGPGGEPRTPGGRGARRRAGGGGALEPGDPRGRAGV